MFVGNSARVIRNCNHPFHYWLQALGEVSPYDKDRVASMVVRDVSIDSPYVFCRAYFEIESNAFCYRVSHSN